MIPYRDLSMGVVVRATCGSPKLMVTEVSGAIFIGGAASEFCEVKVMWFSQRGELQTATLDNRLLCWPRPAAAAAAPVETDDA